MGQPKAELRVHDKPILAYLLHRLAWTGPTMLVTAPSRRAPPGAELFDVEVVDPIDAQGPLCGVCTALANLRTAVAVVATVDMPRVEPRHLRWLIERLHEAESEALMIRHGGRIEPFPSVYRSRAIELVRSCYERGERSVRALAVQGSVAVCDAPEDWDESMWQNLNTPDDFAAFLDDDLSRA